MRCVYVDSFSPDGLQGLGVGRLDPTYPIAESSEDHDPNTWVRVNVRAAALNHHDLWSLKGIGLGQESLPMVLGTDGAGVTDDGREVIIHSVISSPLWQGRENLDPRRTLLSEKYPGTMAREVWVPERNLVDKPVELSFADAACLPTAYLTAYNLLFGSADIKPGQRVLIQGATGGVASAAITLARLGGAHVSVATRSEENFDHAQALGAHETVLTGERVPPVDAVVETVGEATWKHSLRSLKPGGVVAVAGATSGPNPPADLARVFFLNLRVVGTTMGTRRQLQQLAGLLVASGQRPAIHRQYDFDSDTEVQQAFDDLASGRVFGKAVLVMA